MKLRLWTGPNLQDAGAVVPAGEPGVAEAGNAVHHGKAVGMMGPAAAPPVAEPDRVPRPVREHDPVQPAPPGPVAPAVTRGAPSTGSGRRRPAPRPRPRRAARPGSASQARRAGRRSQAGSG